MLISYTTYTHTYTHSYTCTRTHTHTHTHTQEAAIQAQRAEMDLHQKILRETGSLSKTANMREETLQSLVKHRLRAKEERKMLSDEKRVRVWDVASIYITPGTHNKQCHVTHVHTHTHTHTHLCTCWQVLIGKLPAAEGLWVIIG